METQRAAGQTYHDSHFWQREWQPWPRVFHLLDALNKVFSGGAKFSELAQQIMVTKNPALNHGELSEIVRVEFRTFKPPTRAL